MFIHIYIYIIQYIQYIYTICIYKVYVYIYIYICMYVCTCLPFLTGAPLVTCRAKGSGSKGQPWLPPVFRCLQLSCVFLKIVGHFLQRLISSWPPLNFQPKGSPNPISRSMFFESWPTSLPFRRSPSCFYFCFSCFGS